MNSIPCFTVTSSPSMRFCTDAAPRHFWNSLLIKSGSVQHPGSSRYCIPGTRNWITMYICTVLFPAVALRRNIRSRNQKRNILFRSEFSGINLKENILPDWILFIKSSSLCFPLPAKNSVIPMSGRNSVIACIIKNGAHTSRKPLMVLATRSNILADTPIRSPSQTAASCRLMLEK